jgi:hypothetical protein
MSRFLGLTPKIYPARRRQGKKNYMYTIGARELLPKYYLNTPPTPLVYNARHPSPGICAVAGGHVTEKPFCYGVSENMLK